MTQRCALAIVVAACFASGMAAAGAEHDSVQRQHQRLRERVREIIKNSTTDGEAPDPDADSLRERVDWRLYSSPEGVCFANPQYLENPRRRELWYSLGFVSLDDIHLDFSNPLIPPDDPSQPEERASFTCGDPLLYPWRAQFLAELVRGFDRRGRLASDIENVVQKELDWIDQNRDRDAQPEFDGNSLAGDDLMAKLADYDERVVRIVMRFLSDTASQSGYMLRRIRLAGRPLPPSVTAILRFESDQPPDEIWRICNGYFQLNGDRYKEKQEYLKDHRTWTKCDAKPGSGEDWELTVVPGHWHVLAFWTDGNGETFQYDHYDSLISEDGQKITLKPKQVPSPKEVPPVRSGE